MMAATLAEGTTVIENAAKEPEIDDLADSAQRNGRAGARRGHGYHPDRRRRRAARHDAPDHSPTASKPAALSSRRRSPAATCWCAARAPIISKRF